MAAIEITADDLNRAAACARRWAPAQFEEDAYSAACYALFRAAEKFDGRGTWGGYSGERMRWAVLDELRRQSRIAGVPVEADTLAALVESDAQNAQDDTATQRVREALSTLPQSAQDVLRYAGTDKRIAGVRGALEGLREALA